MQKTMNYKIRKTCRSCKSKGLVKILDLGSTALADSFVESWTNEQKYPLQLGVCHNCWLTQLLVDVDSELLFGNDYAFFTGASPSAVEHFKKYAYDLMNRYHRPDNEFVLEIASNDGVMLKEFKRNGYITLGVDPATPPQLEAEEQGIQTLPAFFSRTIAEYIKSNYGQPSIITANNVVAHVEDLNDFMAGVKLLLESDGVFVFEVQYLPHLLFKNQFDNIYHEHRSFFALTPLVKLLNSHNLYIVDVEEVNTQGGSIRVHAKHQAESSDKVAEMLLQEELLGINDIMTYSGMQARANYVSMQLNDLLRKLKKDGKTVFGYGASAKSNTLLSYCNIDSSLLECIVDITPYKFDKFTPGTHIPVVNQKGARKPDYYLLLVWNYLEGVLQREREYRNWGGKFIVPIPTPQII